MISLRTLAVSAVGLILPGLAQAQDALFSGSAALHYKTPIPGEGSRRVLSGMTPEVAFKIEADVSDELLFSGKVCYGCHGFELDRAYMEWTPSEYANVKAGRMPVPFGEFSTRHDPASHKAASKPLPYMMGHMARQENFNLGVLPMPYVDNAVVVYGNLWPTDFLQIYYAVFATSGLKGDNDIDFIRQRAPYYADNNRDVARGGRLLFTLADAPFAEGILNDLSIGGSLINGAYDDKGRLDYWIYGADLSARLGDLTLRGEYTVRRTDIVEDDPGYSFEVIDPWFSKVGWYAELEHPLLDYFSVGYRYDELIRSGVPLPSSGIEVLKTRIRRYTQTLNISPAGGLTFKLSYEYWWYSDFDNLHIGHGAIVGTF